MPSIPLTSEAWLLFAVGHIAPILMKRAMLSQGLESPARFQRLPSGAVQ